MIGTRDGPSDHAEFFYALNTVPVQRKRGRWSVKVGVDGVGGRERKGLPVIITRNWHCGSYRYDIRTMHCNYIPRSPRY